MASVKIQAKGMDDENKESVSSNRKPRKKISKRNLVKPQNTEKFCYKLGEKYQKGQHNKCKAIGKTCYNCGKTNHLSNVCRSKQKQVSKINKTENLEAKKPVNWMMSQIQHKKFLRFRCLAIMKIIYQINQSVALKRNI